MLHASEIYNAGQRARHSIEIYAPFCVRHEACNPRLKIFRNFTADFRHKVKLHGVVCHVVSKPATPMNRSDKFLLKL